MPAPPLLAFLHMHKAAGTTFIEVLRRNFGLAFAEVARVRGSFWRGISPADLAFHQRWRPRLRAIAGHGVAPRDDLEAAVPGIRFVTVLREPLVRHAASYFYLRQVEGARLSLDEFLGDPAWGNYQVKALAGGKLDLERARATLRRLWLVGAVDTFDEFLVQLGAKLAPDPFDARYRARNRGRDRDSRYADQLADLMARRHAELRACNQLDLALWATAQEEILPAQRRAHGPGLDADVAALRARLRDPLPPVPPLERAAAAGMALATRLARRARRLF